MEEKLFTEMINKTKTSVVIFGVASMILATLMSVQSASAWIQDNGRGADDFAAGHVKVTESDSQSASAFAPGILKGKLPPGGCDAPIFTPGHLVKLEPTTTDINP